MGLRDSLRAARRSSVAALSLQRGLQNSSAVDWMVSVPSPVTTVTRWTRSSATVEELRAAGVTARASFDRSGIGRAARAALSFTLSSFLYRWLTAEPGPDVVVVDLDDTIVLGRLLPLVDHLAETFLRSRPGSTVYEAGEETIAFVEDAPIRASSIVLVSAIAANAIVRLGTGSLSTAGLQVRLGLALVALLGLKFDTSMDDLRNSRAIRLLAAILEPPDPGDERVQPNGEHDDVRNPVTARDEEP